MKYFYEHHGCRRISKLFPRTYQTLLQDFTLIWQLVGRAMMDEAHISRRELCIFHSFYNNFNYLSACWTSLCWPYCGVFGKIKKMKKKMKMSWMNILLPTWKRAVTCQYECLGVSGWHHLSENIWLYGLAEVLWWFKKLFNWFRFFLRASEQTKVFQEVLANKKYQKLVHNRCARCNLTNIDSFNT